MRHFLSLSFSLLNFGLDLARRTGCFRIPCVIPLSSTDDCALMTRATLSLFIPISTEPTSRV